MNKFLRPIRSFVRRDSRMTPSQRSALDRLLPLKGLALQPIQFTEVFNRDAPCILEIGFGSGASLLATAAMHPNYDFIGIETYLPGIGSLLTGMELQEIPNIRVYYADAVIVLE